MSPVDHLQNTVESTFDYHFDTITLGPPFQIKKNCENIPWDPKFTPKTTPKTKKKTFALSHLCRFGIGEANGDLGVASHWFLEPRPVKGNKEMVFKKVCFLQKMRATTKSCWQSFRDAERTGKEQLYFRVKKIFKGFGTSICTKKIPSHYNDMCTIFDLFQEYYCTSPSAVWPTKKHHQQEDKHISMYPRFFMYALFTHI